MDTPISNDSTKADLLVTAEQRTRLLAAAADYTSIDLTPRQVCDVELLLNGGFAPLTGFLNQADYDSVCQDMRLASGALWPIPITLDVSQAIASGLAAGQKLALRNPEGIVLAIMTVGDVWQPDKAREAELVYGANDEAHPAVHYLHYQAGGYNVGGELVGLELPTYYDFTEHRYTPTELKAQFKKMGWTSVVAFQTRNPMHRNHVEAVMRAAKQSQAAVVIQPVVGMTKPGDVDHYTRVRVYQEVIKHFPQSTAMISLLPLAMRMAGPREAVWHALIRKNYGMTHFIVGRDHAGPGKNSAGEDFYGPFEAIELAQHYAEEIGIEIISAGFLSYIKNLDKYLEASEITADMEVLNLSGTQLRERLNDGREIPAWFTYPEVAAELRRTYRPRHEQGLVVFFTGLSGAGKSTLANALMVRLLEIGRHSVTMLDGDHVRKHLSSELGFSREHRNLNVRRIGYVAAEIARHGGVAICAPIAPYDIIRKEVRAMVRAATGAFMLVHVATPLDECEKRDRKGLYAAARAGKIKEFTGISDPYEPPKDAEIILNTVDYTVDQLVNQLLFYLEKEGYLQAQA